MGGEGERRGRKEGYLTVKTIKENMNSRRFIFFLLKINLYKHPHEWFGVPKGRTA